MWKNNNNYYNKNNNNYRRSNTSYYNRTNNSNNYYYQDQYYDEGNNYYNDNYKNRDDYYNKGTQYSNNKGSYYHNNDYQNNKYSYKKSYSQVKEVEIPSTKVEINYINESINQEKQKELTQENQNETTKIEKDKEEKIIKDNEIKINEAPSTISVVLKSSDEKNKDQDKEITSKNETPKSEELLLKKRERNDPPILSNKQSETAKPTLNQNQPANTIKDEDERLQKEISQIQKIDATLLENSKKQPEFDQALLSDVEKYMKIYNTEVKEDEFMSFCTKDKENIKIVEKEYPLNKNFMLVDVSMNPKGLDEEKAYLEHEEYCSVIRRGNTILDEYKFNSRIDDYEFVRSKMLRKGMKKFIDLPFDFYIYDEKIKKLKLNLSTTQPLERQSTLKYIFYPLIEARKDNYLIEIIKLMKANGENAQISYSKVLNAWVIASKNVCLCASNRDDLSKYPTTAQVKKEEKDDYNNYNNNYSNNYKYKSKKSEYETVPTRYSFAVIIGHCWFDILENYTNEEINTMKEYMSNKTFVGEYVGNQYHQHLIRYLKHTILFFGIVQNDNYLDNSLPVIEAFDVFKKFKLDVVPYEYIGSYSRIEDVFISLRKLYIRIAESSIIDEEEGSVVYLSRTGARSLNSDKKYRAKDKILALCKLKTLEYRIYRKLREKLKNHLADPNNNYDNSRRKISQFFEEVRIMLEGFNLPMPIDFYYKVAETAFDFVNYYKYNNLLQDLHGSYIDFIETIHSIVDDTVNLKSRVIQLDNIMTYDYLIKNQYKAKKVVEVIIYAPPCLISENFLKDLSNKFNTIIYNDFIQNDNYININNDVIIYHINMHNFRKIYKLEKNKFIILFGLNEDGIDKSEKIFNEKIKNPLFKTYNKNKSLLPFLKYDNDPEGLKELFKYYKKESLKLKTRLEEMFKGQVMIYDDFTDTKSTEYIDTIKTKVNQIKLDLENIDISTIEKDSFYSNTKTLISLTESSNPLNNTPTPVNRTKKNSKYKNSTIISLYEEHINPYNELKDEFIANQKSMYESTSKKSTINQSSSSNYNKHVIVIIPMTFPGNGKTYFINQIKPILEKYKIPFYSVSSDLIRRSIMDNDLKSNRRMTVDEAFKKSGVRANYQFEKELADTFNKIYTSSYTKKAVIYIDKNHPPNAISRSTEPIRKYLNNNMIPDVKLKLEFVALIPDCISSFEFIKNGNKSSIPFSLSYFLQCYLRVKHRDDHPTLNGDNKELIAIFGIFIQNFINVKLDESNIITYQKLDRAIKLPFTDEIDEDQLPDELVKVFSTFCGSLISHNRDGYSMNNIMTPTAEQLEHLINKYYPKGNEFFSTKNLVMSTAEPIVTKIFNIEQGRLNKVENFIYLGIVIKGEKNYVKFNSKISSYLKKLMGKFIFDNKNVEDEIRNLVSKIQIVKGYLLPEGWKYPHNTHKNLWHCTTLFKGNVNSNFVKSKEEYIDFEEGKVINVNVIGVVYVPERIIVSIIDIGETKCGNEYPHITTFINKYAPKKSNDVMKEVLNGGEDDDIVVAYRERMKDWKGEDGRGDAFFEKMINVDGDKCMCYVVMFGCGFKLEGVMHAFE